MSASPIHGWVPGVLSNAQLAMLCEAGWIQGLSDKKQIDYSSFDLTLSNEGYEMVKGSIKPCGKSFEHFLVTEKSLIRRIVPEAEGTFVLKAKTTYIFRLQQQLGPEIRSESIYGQATAKSSVGRVDVLARLIVDGMDSYECFDPEGVSKGNGHMYVEITPITFSVCVREGVSLSQLRLFFGKPEYSEIRGTELYSSVLINGGNDGCLRVDLSEASIHQESGCAFCATVNTSNVPVPLWEDKANAPDPKAYWKLERPVVVGNRKYMQITKERFYILRSIESIALPAGVAVYCRAIDETIGEMRIHYAGFVHPLFGRDRKDNKIGTPLIFEVRGHDVEVLLSNEEKMARLIFYRMSQDCVAGTPSEYSDQILELSKFFGKWK
jgi:dCTP deaminase